MGQVGGHRSIWDYMWVHKDLVEKETLDGLNKGSKQSITDALNQIHWKSLRNRKAFVWNEEEQGATKGNQVKTYAEVLSTDKVQTDRRVSRLGQKEEC